MIPDTAILERYLELDRATIRERIAEAKAHSMVKPSTLARYINYENFYTLQEHLWKFKGVYFEKSFTRDYLSQVGANFLGYISEVNDGDIEKSSGYYDPGDLIGATGLERQYEELLRGRKGVRMVLTDVFNREVGSFAEGKYDTVPEKGKDVVISIDMDLQKFGEEMMAHKKGSIVAIEPKTGEILSFVSAPTYDPRLLSGTELKKELAPPDARHAQAAVQPAADGAVPARFYLQSPERDDSPERGHHNARAPTTAAPAASPATGDGPPATPTPRPWPRPARFSIRATPFLRRLTSICCTTASTKIFTILMKHGGST